MLGTLYMLGTIWRMPEFGLCICICICLEPFHTINNVNVDQAIFMIYDICWSSHLFVNVDLYDIWYSIYLLTSLMNICVVPDNGKYFENDTTSSPSDSSSPSGTSASLDGCYSPTRRSADARCCGRGGTTLVGTSWVVRYLCVRRVERTGRSSPSREASL